MAITQATYPRSYASNSSGVISDRTNLGQVIIQDTDTPTPDESVTVGTDGEISGSVTTTPINNVVKYSSTTNEVLVQSTDKNTYYVLTNTDYDSSGNATFDYSNGTYTYCFLTGTQIATPHGEIAVETLQVGDEILTHTGATAKVRFNFVQKYHNHFFINKEDTYPICIKAGALADNVPSRDLYVTPDHAIYFPEWNIFANALTLVNGTSIYQMRDMPETFTYYHILCDNQEIVLAENTPAETFIDNVSMETFDNYAEYAAMYPQEHEMIELDIPRGKSERQLPRKLKQDIANRAATLYPIAQAA